MRLVARLIRSGGLDPRLNMALDHAVEPEPPVLRLYRFDPPGLSLGYFQSATEFSEEWLAERGWVLVRRPTGGAAICHVDDVTFAWVAEPGAAIFRGDVETSYRRIHAAVSSALAALGVVSGPRDDSAVASDSSRDREGVCFHRATRYDVVAAGRKLVGSAQRRTRDRILHHGSIPITPNPLATEAASLETLLGYRPDPSDVEKALIEAFADQFGIFFEESEPTPVEWTRACELVATQFGHDDWNRKR